MPPEASAIAMLGWIARAQAIATKSYHGAAEDWLVNARAPEKAVRIFKSPLGAGNLTGADLGEYGVALGDFSDSMRTKSAFYRILSDSGFVRLPVNTRVGITVAPASASVRSEGHAIPMSPLTLSNVLLQPTLASSLLVVTDELLRDVSSAGQTALNRALMGAVSDAVDSAFLDLITDTGTTSLPSSGATASDAKGDLRTALMAVNSTGGSSRLYWIAGVDVAKRASVLATADGADAFVAMSAMGGEMANLPAVVSSGIAPDTLLLVDASGIAADGGPVTVSASSQADILMDTAPAMNATTPTPAEMVSMFQSNSTALKADAWFGAQVLRDDAVAVVTGISWGA